jgi:NADH:ubiquinone reductase (H+-translocating)
VPDVPGMAQGAIQGAHYVTKLIKNTIKGKDDPATREPFKYFDKGSMATISRHSAVAKVGKLEFGGYFAWLAWLVLHLFYLVGHRNRIAALFSWWISFVGRSRGQMAITSQMIYARSVINWMTQTQAQDALSAAEEAEHAEQEAVG